MAYDYRPLRDRTLPTLEEARKAVKKADTRGDSRDVRPLLATLARMVEADPRLAGHVLTRRTAITSFDYALERVDGQGRAVRDDAEAGRARERLDGVVRACMKQYVEAPLFGCLVGEVDWAAAEDASEVRAAAVRWRDPDEVERPEPRLESVRLLSWEEGKAMTRTPLPAGQARDRYLVAVDDSRWVGGSLRSILYRQILLTEGLAEWANYLRKLKGIVSGQFTGGVPPAGDPERETAEQALRTAMSENYALTSDLLSFQFDRLVEAASGSSFEAFKAAMEADAAIAILGQANTAELPSGGGSRAALQVLNLIRRDIHHADIAGVEALVNGQLLPADYRQNVDGGAARAPWRFRVVVEQETDDEANARAVADALDALEGTGAELPASEVYERLGYTMPAGTAETIARRRATESPGLGLAGAGA